MRGNVCAAPYGLRFMLIGSQQQRKRKRYTARAIMIFTIHYYHCTVCVCVWLFLLPSMHLSGFHLPFSRPLPLFVVVRRCARFNCCVPFSVRGVCCCVYYNFLKCAGINARALFFVRHAIKCTLAPNALQRLCSQGAT